jgi:uncharacterized RDD family membrane protein YckC
MPTPPDTPSLVRRLAAMLYDGLLLASVLFVAGIPLAFVPETVRHQLAARLLIRLYLLAVVFLFFAVPWTRGGRTLGMQAWRLRLVAVPGGPLGWGHAARRFAAALLSWACLGLGFVWILVDREGRAWHDRLSGTRMVLEPGKRGGEG